MACGAPVLVSRVGAVPEVVGDCGAYVDAPSAEGIRDGLADYLRARQGAVERAQRGLLRVRSLFSVERRRDDLRRLLDELRPAA
jgi:glycosyltransferase involved in cell wall biosynthesis